MAGRDQCIELGEPAVGKLDQHLAALGRVGDECKLDILAGALPRVERVARQALRRGRVDRAHCHGHHQHCNCSALGGEPASGRAAALLRIAWRHLLGERHELAAACRQPGGQLGRQRCSSCGVQAGAQAQLWFERRRVVGELGQACSERRARAGPCDRKIENIVERLLGRRACSYALAGCLQRLGIFWGQLGGNGGKIMGASRKPSIHLWGQRDGRLGIEQIAGAQQWFEHGCMLRVRVEAGLNALPGLKPCERLVQNFWQARG